MTIFAVQITWEESDYPLVKFIEAVSIEAARAEVRSMVDGDPACPSQRHVYPLQDYIEQNMLDDFCNEETADETIVEHEMTADDYYYEETYREFQLMQQSKQID